MLGFACAVVLRRRLGLLALCGIPLGVLLWIVFWAAGAFEDDPEGTSGLLTFFYGVPAVSVAWALGVGLAAVAGARR